MPLSDLLSPWIGLGVVLALLVLAEKWIHSHLYGVGWLLTNDQRSATALYYVILMPGVFLHEFTQWLMAGALNVATKRVVAWPEAQADGTLRLDFVQIRRASWLQSAIIGAIPLITGTALIWVISNHILNLEDFIAALDTRDLALIGAAIQDLGSTPDFYLWLYLMFAISNGMFPTPADRKGWPLLLGIFAACIAFLVVIGVGEVLLETFTGPVAHTVEVLTTAFGAVLTVEVLAIVAIGFLEEILERATKRKFDYGSHARAARARQPGSSLPLPPGVPLPSIYNLQLPVPDPSDPRIRARKARAMSAAAPQTAPAPAGPIRRELPSPASEPAAVPPRVEREPARTDQTAARLSTPPTAAREESDALRTPQRTFGPERQPAAPPGSPPGPARSPGLTAPPERTPPRAPGIPGTPPRPGSVTQPPAGSERPAASRPPAGPPRTAGPDRPTTSGPARPFESSRPVERTPGSIRPETRDDAPKREPSGPAANRSFGPTPHPSGGPLRSPGSTPPGRVGDERKDDGEEERRPVNFTPPTRSAPPTPLRPPSSPPQRRPTSPFILDDDELDLDDEAEDDEEGDDVEYVDFDDL
ncbi:MAG: hypothetical protein GXY36_08740 [Chloroflexi bacterium]|nr:hypothetical protein [Chloroflexota bacterium]